MRPIALLIGIALLAAPSLAQPDQPVDLAWAFQPGERLDFRFRAYTSILRSYSTPDATSDGKSEPKTIESVAVDTVDFRWEIMAVHPDGHADIRGTISRMDAPIRRPLFDLGLDYYRSGPLGPVELELWRPLVGKSFRWELDRRGRVSDLALPETDSDAKLIRSSRLLFILLRVGLGLPTTGTGIGTAWHAAHDAPNHTLKRTFRLHRRIRHGQHDLAVIDISDVARMDRRPPWAPNTGLTAARHKVESRGQLQWDVKNGRLHHWRVESRQRLHGEVFGIQIPTDVAQEAMVRLLRDGPESLPTVTPATPARLLLVDQATGRPIEGARVAAGGSVVVTNSDGHASAPRLPLSITTDHHPPCTCHFLPTASSDSDAPLRVVIPRAAGLDVRARSASGKAAGGVRITIRPLTPSRRPSPTGVELRLAPVLRATADDEGRALIQGIPASTPLELTVDLTDCDLRVVRKLKGLEPGQTLSVTVAPPVLATVRGIVVSGRGQPVPGAEVRLVELDEREERVAYNARGNPARIGVDTPRTVQTDTLGRFSFAAVHPGIRTVVVTSGVHGFRRTLAYLDVPTYPSDVRCKVTVGTGKAIRGRVIGPRGRPIPRVTVQAAFLQASVLTGQDGTFSLTGFDEDVRVRALGRDLYRTTTWMHVEPGSEDVVIRMPAGAILRGSVLDQSGRLVRTARVSLYTPRGGRPLPSTRALGETAREIEESSVTARQGDFTFKTLDPGQYSLVATTPEGRVGVIDSISVDAGQVRSGLTVCTLPGATLQLSTTRGKPDSLGLASLFMGVNRFTVRRGGVVVAKYDETLGTPRPIRVPSGRLRITLVFRDHYKAPNQRLLEREVTLKPNEARPITFLLPERKKAEQDD